jgi:CheY-like chemotaxis protein
MPDTTIFIIEDDGLIALRTMELLIKAGHHVPDPAPTGEDALEYLASHDPPDLMLMDIGLAGKIDGIETARRVREHYKIPVIFISAYTNDTIVNRMNAAGPAGYLVKPFLDRDLLALTEKVLGRRKTQA